MRELIFDTETTGLSYTAGDRIVSLALVELLRKEPTGRFLHFYFNPERESTPGAFAVHKLSREFLADKPLFRDVYMSILDFIAGAPLIIHNAQFDIGFLNAELERAGRGPNSYGGRRHCTKCQSQKRYGGSRGHRLDDLVARFGLRDLRKDTGAHGALVDSLLLVNVYRRLEGLPEYPIDLSRYLVDGHETEQTSSGEGLPSVPQPDSADQPLATGAGGSGASEELQRDDRLHHADEAGVAESGGAAA